MRVFVAVAHWTHQVPSTLLSQLCCILQVLNRMVEERIGDRDLSAPSVSYGSTNLYMHGPLESETRHNLSKVG